jgi:3-oxoacyl-(acyl-carrier-protein) synthase
MIVVTDPRPVDPAAVTMTQVLTGEPVVLARGGWPVGDEDETLPQIAGFVMSNFSPLVAVVAERCLRAHYGTAPADPVRGATTGVVLASVRGDVTTVDTVAGALRDGRRVPPLLFFQSNPNAVVGHVTSRWGLAGPVVCTSPLGDPLADGLAVAALLIEDDAATEVLVIAADLAEHAGERDHAVAVLVAGTVG